VQNSYLKTEEFFARALTGPAGYDGYNGSGQRSWNSETGEYGSKQKLFI